MAPAREEGRSIAKAPAVPSSAWASLTPVAVSPGLPQLAAPGHPEPSPARLTRPTL